MALAGETLDHRHLLQILLPKHRKTRPYGLKQQVDHRHHAVKMSRAMGAFIRIRERPPIHAIAPRACLRTRSSAEWREHGVCTGIRRKRGVRSSVRG